MDLMENNSFYYFKMLNGHCMRIVVLDREINLMQNPSFVAFSQEQKAFYVEHPTASVFEVWKCEMTHTSIPIPVETPIETLRDEAMQEIDGASRFALHQKVDVLGFCDAIASTVYKPSKDDSIYTDDETLKTADDFLRIGKLCRDKVKELTPLIQNAESKGEIENIVETAKAFFESVAATDDSIEAHKRNKLREIEVYDISENVKGFFLGDTLLWLDKDTRSGLVNTLNSAVIVGRDNVNIWFSGLYITLHIEEARQMLAALEIYATDCYNVTAMHKMQVNEMNDVDSIDAFDVTADYPQRLVFNMQNK